MFKLTLASVFYLHAKAGFYGRINKSKESIIGNIVDIKCFLYGVFFLADVFNDKYFAKLINFYGKVYFVKKHNTFFQITIKNKPYHKLINFAKHLSLEMLTNKRPYIKKFYK